MYFPAREAGVQRQCAARPFPYYFFTNAMQGMMYGGAAVGDKPAGYRAPVRITGSGSGVA